MVGRRLRLVGRRLRPTLFFFPRSLAKNGTDDPQEDDKEGDFAKKSFNEVHEHAPDYYSLSSGFFCSSFFGPSVT